MEDLKIIAAVGFNNGEAYVLNRMPVLLYERDGDRLIASDGPFRNSYEFEMPSERFKAFGGRAFDIPMKDGGVTKAKGQWWDVHTPNTVSFTHNTIENLKNCYVFFSGSVVVEKFEEIRSEYTGCVYPYRDYEKVINYDDERNELWDRIRELSKENKKLRMALEAHAALDKI